MNNETIKKIWQYVLENIKAHPKQSVFTIITAVAFVFTLISNTHVDLYITSQEVRANAQAIQLLNTREQNDHDSILILQQIAKDSVASQQNMSQQLQNLNTTFQNYLLNKVH